MLNMMTSSYENIFRVNVPLWGKSIGDQYIPLTKAGDAELWWFVWSAPKEMIGQKLETPAVWDVTALIMTSP